MAGASWSCKTAKLPIVKVKYQVKSIFDPENMDESTLKSYELYRIRTSFSICIHIFIYIHTYLGCSPNRKNQASGVAVLDDG
jgi:hypothetical protein